MERLATAVLGLPPSSPWHGSPGTLRPEGPACSSALLTRHPQGGPEVVLAAAAVYHDVLHLVKWEASSSGAAAASSSSSQPVPSALGCTAIHLALAGLFGFAPGERLVCVCVCVCVCVVQIVGFVFRSCGAHHPSHVPHTGPEVDIQHSVHVRALQLLPQPPQPPGSPPSLTCFLAVLYQREGPSVGPSPLHLDCLELDWQRGAASPGPWSCRNVHPTTNLLLPFGPPDSPQPPGAGPRLPGGVLVFSSRSLLLFSCPPPPSVLELAGAVAAAQGSHAAAAASLADSLAGERVGRGLK
jgi:hypothetical protein